MQRRLIVLIGAFFVFCPLGAYGQPIRYMDESGNLHWVDSLEEVPRQYRNQVLRPTPIPTYRKGHRPPPKKKPKPTRKPKPRPKPKQPKAKQEPTEGPVFQRGQPLPPIPTPPQYPQQAPHDPPEDQAGSHESSGASQPHAVEGHGAQPPPAAGPPVEKF